MKTICAWCQKLLRGSPDDKITSHTICEKCEKKENEKLEKLP